MSANYIDDATDVEPINSYEETDEQFDQFQGDLWEHAVKPQTFPDDVDSDANDFDWDDVERVPDEDLAENKAEKWFKFAYGYAGYGRGATRENLVVFKLPGWFANDELGQWEEWWFGSLEVAKEDDDGEFTAMCLSDIEPMCDRNEDDYFRNAVEEEWVPFSLIDFAFTVTQEIKDSHLIFDRGLDSDSIDFERGESGEADIVVKHVARTQYGRKWIVDSPFEAKDDFSDLDWDRYHANWNGDNWEFDETALWSFIEEMTMQGWSVCVKERVENQTTSDSLDDGPYLPREATETGE